MKCPKYPQTFLIFTFLGSVVYKFRILKTSNRTVKTVLLCKCLQLVLNCIKCNIKLKVGKEREPGFKVESLNFVILFYFKEMSSLLSAVLNGTWFRASESLTFHTLQIRANTENSHGIEIMMSQYCAQNEFDEITVQVVPALPHWFHFLRTPHYCNVQSQGHPHCNFLPQNHLFHCDRQRRGRWGSRGRRGRGGRRGRWLISGRRGRRGRWWGIRRRIGQRGWRGQRRWRWSRFNEYYYC